MSPRRRADPRQGGFTLIEILLAMLVFMAGVAGIYGLLSTALGMQRQGLEASRVTRRLEQVVFRLERELGQGLHVDTAEDRWLDVEAGSLDDGTWFRVRFPTDAPSEAEGRVLVALSAAASRAGLDRARPVPYLLTPGPTTQEAVRAARERSPPR